MIFFFDSNGDLFRSVPENVYQGSNKHNRIYVVAPFPQASVVSVAFKLPNGKRTVSSLLSLTPATGALTDYVTSDNKDVFVWVLDIPAWVTDYSGNVTAQFYITGADEQVLTTSSVQFNVLQGVPPAEPSPQDMDDLISAFADLMAYWADFKDDVQTALDDIVEYEGIIDYIPEGTDAENQLQNAEQVASAINTAVTPVSEKATQNESDIAGIKLLYNTSTTSSSNQLQNASEVLALIAANALDKNTKYGKSIAASYSNNTTLSIQLKDQDGNNLNSPVTVTIDLKSIKDLIPQDATSSNQLADKAFVNSSIATNTAYFLGTYDIVTDLSLTTSATEQQIAAALANYMTAHGIAVSNNDYVFVAFPDTYNPSQYSRFDRYKYNSDDTAWAYEYTLNNSSFTAAQWAAINSGITASLVTKLNGIEAGAQVNVKADWNATSGDAQILNKPAIPTKTSDLTNDSGFITTTAVNTLLADKFDKPTGLVTNYLLAWDGSTNKLKNSPVKIISTTGISANGISIGQYGLGTSGLLLEVGNGTNISNKNNAFSVDSLGMARAYWKTGAVIDNNALLTKSYCDAHYQTNGGAASNFVNEAFFDSLY